MMRALFLLYAIWGFNWVVMKTANAYFPPVLFVAFRFLIGAAVMLSVCAWRRIPVPERKYWKWITATGILQIAVNNVCMQIGMYSLTAGVVSVLNYTMPVWMAILAQLFLKERLTLRKIAGIAICIAGLFVLMDIHDLGNMTAVSIVLAGAAAWAASGIILKRHLQDSPPLQYSAWQMVVGSLLLFIVALIVPQPSIHWTTTAAACLLYNGILAAAVGFFLWNYILAHMEAGKAGVAILVVPVVGVVSGILVLGEAFTWHTALGILLVLGGFLLIVKPRRPRLSLTH